MLSNIVKQVKINLETRKKQHPSFANLQTSQRDFKAAIEGKQHLALIAEVKKASPSQGSLNENFNHLQLAQQYSSAGASCISVLTEESFFHGSQQYLYDISRSLALPVLCKDFIVDTYQIEEARFYGADAILLMANLLSFQQLKEFIQRATNLKMSVLLEVHSEDELKNALKLYADNVLIGVNNRNLQTLKIDLNTVRKLAPLLPKDVVSVAESGYQSAQDLEAIKGLVDGVLIGSSIVSSSNALDKINSLFSLSNAH